MMDAVAKSPVSDPGKELLQINSYYGSQVALYYGFLSFYTKNLIPATIGGSLLFLFQLFHQQVDCAWLPVFCLSITVWSTLYLELWKRRCSELAYAWGVYGCEDKELTAELAKSASKETSSVEVRRALSAVCLLSLVSLQVLLMLRYNHLQAHAEEYFGRAWYTPYAPSALYFALCNVGSAVFYPLSTRLNDFEMHATKAQAEGALVVKRFAFNFVNQFSVLFHAAFWQRDLHRVRTLSFYAFISHAVMNQVLQQVLPRLKPIYNALTKKEKLGLPDSAKSSVSASVSASDRQRGEEADYWETRVAAELERPAVDLEDDYLEMALQFGHLSMFAVAFPLAPLLAYLNNIVEFRSDFSKLCAARRPPAQIRSSIGAWQSCFEFLSFASVFTNCFLLAMVSANIKTIIPAALHADLETDWGRLAAMMVVEHILIALKIGIMLVVDDVPQWLRESLARDKMRAEAERLQALVQDPPIHSAPMSPWTSASAPSTPSGESTSSTRPHHTPRLDETPKTTFTSPGETPSSKKTDRSLLAEQVAREDKIFGPTAHAKSSHRHPSAADLASEQTASRLVKETSGQFGYDPINLSALVAIPPLLAHYGVSPFLYLPLAALYFSYLQASKDRADRKAALGIVSDPALVKLVVKELPRWVSDSEHQRVEWFNSLLQRFWPQLSLALEAQLIAQIQAALDSQVAAVRVGLTVKRFSLGTISPKIVGIRLHETQESVIRLDVEIRWAGDLLLCIAVGKSAFAPPVELSEVRFSALVRIELIDLMPTLPCFRAVAVTFMKTPDVHFSLKIASLDFMNMGPADFNITALVRAAIDSALQGMAVYPKKMMFPLVAESPEAAADEHAHDSNGSGTSATGVLYLTFERGVNIKKSSLLWCNPYIVARTAKGQSFQSKAVYATRNPEWGQTFELLVFDAATQVVEVEVRDADPTRAGVSLGKVIFGLNKLQTSRSVECTVDLMGVDEGALVLTYEYIPMQKSGPQEESDHEDEGDDDIIYALTKTDLESDVLCRDEEQMEDLNRETLRRRSLPPALHNGQRGPAPTLGAGLSRLVVSRRFASTYSVGIVSISMIHVRNLKTESYLLSSSRPYVEVSVDSKVHSTKPISGTSFPHYPEKFSLIVRDLANQKLLVAVKNRRKLNAAKVLGSVEIPLSEVVLSGGTLEQEYILHGAEAEFFVGLRLEVITSS